MLPNVAPALWTRLETRCPIRPGYEAVRSLAIDTRFAAL